MLVRHLADGDYVVALFNWASNAVDVKVSHVDIQQWCNLHKPVSLKVTQAWTKESLPLSAGDEAVISYKIQGFGTMLLQVELTDSL